MHGDLSGGSEEVIENKTGPDFDRTLPLLLGGALNERELASEVVVKCKAHSVTAAGQLSMLLLGWSTFPDAPQEKRKLVIRVLFTAMRHTADTALRKRGPALFSVMVAICVAPCGITVR